MDRTTVSPTCAIANAHAAGHQIAVHLPLKVNETELCLCYTLRYIRGGPVDIALQTTLLTDLVTAETTLSSGQVFHQTALSFANIFFGTEHGEARIVRNGYVIRGRALKQLNQALSDSECYKRDEVILSVITLALTECFVPTGSKEYLKHMIGLERLLELRGPGSNCSSKTSVIQKGSRYMILFASLVTRKPSILARQEWKTVLRAKCSEEEVQEQDLFDVLADCTVLFADRDTMMATWKLDVEKDARQRDGIYRMALTLLAQLCVWRERWSSHGRNSCSECSAASLEVYSTEASSVDESNISFTVLTFSNKLAATMLMFYNTALIYVFRVLASLPGEKPDTSSNQTPSQHEPHDEEHANDHWEQLKSDYVRGERSAALEICRCIPYLVRNTHFSSRVFHLAVATVSTTLCGDESVEAEWMRHILNTKGRESMAKGLRMG